MKQLIAAAFAAAAMLFAGTAGAATHRVDLDGFALGQTLTYADITNYPPGSGYDFRTFGVVVDGPQGGRSVRVDASVGDIDIMLFPLWVSYDEEARALIKFFASATFDVYSPDGVTLQTPGPKIVLPAGGTTNYEANVKFKYGTAYLTNIDVTTMFSPTPEPQTWAMMIIGFGGVGAMLRSSRRRDELSA
ncbi:MAG: PEPxxWA-CTERM sorting domain-containing protein [Phenylobacterium sp.]|nr:PEPxxWA-CTERM sorting domain-containing protein [Phenylobacterium sp.]MDP1599030.1 PEPxxWA-CTERM sorting domain-containing protein [Phenylobacterium sp.]MDP3590458.1 PEPxxWA-CTERM sorting domain-containing protein [Phenylobacterium sp.]